MGFFAELERAIRGSDPKPKMMVFGFPSNSTVQCVELPFFEWLIALARSHGILVVHDLAYADIVFDGFKAPSIMQVEGAKDFAVEFPTLSKSYNIAGWRIGFMVGNAELVAALSLIKSYFDYGSFTPVQVAAIAALEGDPQRVREIAATAPMRPRKSERSQPIPVHDLLRPWIILYGPPSCDTAFFARSNIHRES